MFPQIGPQTVIIFKHIQFVGEWKRTFPLYGMSYEALVDKAEVIVVEEVKSGADVTYWFALKKADEVFVSYGDSQIHVPAPCMRKVEGDQTRCG